RSLKCDILHTKYLTNVLLSKICSSELCCMKNNIALVTKQNRMPIAIWALTVSVFAIGTTEVVMIGLLPTIAKGFSISIASTGWLVTSYAIGVAIGGPVVTAFTNKLNRKKLLLAIILLFVASNALASVSSSFTLLVFAR